MSSRRRSPLPNNDSRVEQIRCRPAWFWNRNGERA